MPKHHIEIHPENSGNLKSNPYMNWGCSTSNASCPKPHKNEMIQSNLQCKQSVNSYMTIIQSVLSFTIFQQSKLEKHRFVSWPEATKYH